MRYYFLLLLFPFPSFIIQRNYLYHQVFRDSFCANDYTIGQDPFRMDSVSKASPSNVVQKSSLHQKNVYECQTCVNNVLPSVFSNLQVPLDDVCGKALIDKLLPMKFGGRIRTCVSSQTCGVKPSRSDGSVPRMTLDAVLTMCRLKVHNDVLSELKQWLVDDAISGILMTLTSLKKLGRSDHSTVFDD